MAAVVAYALRRTSARVVLAVGALGLLWTVGAAQPFVSDVGTGAKPITIPVGVYRVLGSGFSPSDVMASALVVVVALVAAVVLYRERRGR